MPASTQSSISTVLDASMFDRCDAADEFDHGMLVRDRFLQDVLRLFRFIGAAYATDAAECWEAAFCLAETTPGISDGALLVARVAAIFRIIRRARSARMVYLPPCCKRLSQDEMRLIRLLEAARYGTEKQAATASASLGPDEQTPIIEAVRALNALSPVQPHLELEDQRSEGNEVILDVLAPCAAQRLPV